MRCAQCPNEASIALVSKVEGLGVVTEWTFICVKCHKEIEADRKANREKLTKLAEEHNAKKKWWQL